MNNNEIILLAETNFRGQRKKFGIKKDDRRRHMYIVGKTGMGKSVFIENMIIADIRADRGVAVIDPHGDLVEKVIDFIPARRINDVIYFNPADIEYPVAFNILEKVDPSHRHLVASGLIGVFKKIWADSWGPRLEYVLRNAILALLDYPGSTLLGIMRLLTDKEFRKKVVVKIEDPVVKSFWVEEYSKYPDKFKTEAIAPIQNKVGQFLSSALIRNIVGQVKSSINLREIMDEKKILLLNLAKGRIGEDNSALLGGMIITKLQLAAMERVDVPEEEREDFYLYVDEFQNFSTDSFANILSEARKYHLNLVVVHQYIEQLSDKVKAAIFGNVGTLIVFRVGAEDAEFLTKEFVPQFTETDLVNLAKYNIYIKLMIDGVASSPFSAVTLPPLSNREGNKDKIIRVSRERYAHPKKVVEDKIRRWSGMVEEVREKVELEEDKESTARKNEAQCWVCGKKTFVSFIPDGIRPVYCKSCLKKVKKGLIKPVQSKSIVKEMTNQSPITPQDKSFVKISEKQPREEKKAQEFSPAPISLKEIMEKEPISFRQKKVSSKEDQPIKKKELKQKEQQEEDNKRIKQDNGSGNKNIEEKDTKELKNLQQEKQQIQKISVQSKEELKNQIKKRANPPKVLKLGEIIKFED